MPVKKTSLVIAILTVAIMALEFMLSGCCTPRMIDEVKVQINDVETQNQQTQEMVVRIDSVMSAEAQASKQLRNEMSLTVDELQRQISTLLENYNDLMQRIEKLNQQPRVQGVIKSSPGVQSESATTETTLSPDCENTYDEAFILVRRGEYETAIEGFRTFLDQCKNHELVENAYYWVGECYYSLEKYDQAITEFEYLIDNYKSSINASRALYKLGRSKQELGQKDQAIRMFQRLVDDYPGTLEAEQAKERLKDLR